MIQKSTVLVIISVIYMGTDYKKNKILTFLVNGNSQNLL